MDGFIQTAPYSRAWWGGAVNLGMAVIKPHKLEAQKKRYEEYRLKMPQNGILINDWYTFLGCRVIYGVTVEEYYTYEFYFRNHKGRKSFVTDINRFAFYEAFNHDTRKRLFDNKYQTYQRYKKYYKRDIIRLSSDTDEETVKRFLEGKRKVVIKPYNSFFGRGIEVYNVDPYTCEKIKEKTKCDGECIVEDYIYQSEAFSKLHPQSVNTVRIPAYATYNKLGHVTINRPFLKIGVGNSVVDNGGAGGMLIAIDATTGITKSVGIDEYGNEYVIHPDTGEKVVGFQIPEWNSLIRLVDEIMRIDPDTKYVGWDFAHTDDGWVLVEGNDDGQFVGQQMPLKKGCFQEVRSILKTL